MSHNYREGRSCSGWGGADLGRGEGSAWRGGGTGRERGGSRREGESPKETTISVSQYHAGFRTGIWCARGVVADLCSSPWLCCRGMGDRAVDMLMRVVLRCECIESPVAV